MLRNQDFIKDVNIIIGNDEKFFKNTDGKNILIEALKAQNYSQTLRRLMTLTATFSELQKKLSILSPVCKLSLKTAHE